MKYKTKIDPEDIFNEKNISKQTVDMLCWLDYMYWMNDNERAIIDNVRKKIRIGNRKDKMKLYQNNNFKNTVFDENAKSPTGKETQIAKIDSNETFFKRIFNKIKNFLCNN